MMERDSAAEYFLGLIDSAMAALKGDGLRELDPPSRYIVTTHPEEGPVVVAGHVIDSAHVEEETQADEAPARAAASAPSLARGLNALLEDCHSCPLWMNRNERTMVGQGSVRPLYLFVTDRVRQDGSFLMEAEEDFFRKWLQGLRLDVRKEVHVTSVIKCPSVDDVIEDGCEVLLKRQIEVLKPRVIVTIGSAGAFLASGDGDVFSARGAVRQYHGTPVVCTFSPSMVMDDYKVLRRLVWKDLKLAAGIAGTLDRL